MSTGTILEGTATLPPMEDDNRQTQPKPKRLGNARERFRLLNTFVDCTLRDLGRADVAVWLVLYRDSKDGTARAGQSYIANRAGICRRTVATAIGRLEQAGLLEIVHRGGINRGLSTYRIRATARPP